VSPRVREEIVHPRLQLGASARPLNFAVRGHDCPPDAYCEAAAAHNVAYDCA
jgi:hypothetical protein